MARYPQAHGVSAGCVPSPLRCFIPNVIILVCTWEWFGQTKILFFLSVQNETQRKSQPPPWHWQVLNDHVSSVATVSAWCADPMWTIFITVANSIGRVTKGCFGILGRVSKLQQCPLSLCPSPTVPNLFIKKKISSK